VPDRLHILGIRHHGPGSALSMERALESIRPEVVLVEGPPEADEILSFAASPAMRPPLALLAYTADDPSLSIFYPFAEYSPEWRAILWALAHKKVVRFFDLPVAHRLAAMAADRDAKKLEPDTLGAKEPGTPTQVSTLRRDPLTALAAAAGYSDGEAWWNSLIEQGVHAPELFLAIESGMTTLRETAEHDGPQSPEDEMWEPRREAHMRIEAARALKQTAGEVAAVVGAWHVPALRRRVPVKEDHAQLRGLAKTKVSVTWVPWTEPRLASSSGYRAGIISPAWYAALWRELSTLEPGAPIDRRNLVARWLSRAARLLRDAGLSASTANVIETVRLAEAIAALRGLAVPGLPEMRDASLAALCGGEIAPLRLIEERLIVGTAVGEIDETVPQMPLQADLAKWQKRFRLKPEALEEEIALDLRTEAGSAKSQLLHRLALINVPWGRLLDPGGSRGTFRERWLIAWTPELSVRIAEALVWGATVEQAASGAAVERTRQATGLGQLAELVSACLFAGLADAARLTIDALQAGASNGAIEAMIEAVPPLAQILRYGTARELPAAELRLLVLGLSERVCVGLTYACRNLDSQQAAAMRTRLDAFNRAVPLIANDSLSADWVAVLVKLGDDDQAAPLLAGFAVRRLYDQTKIDATEAALRLSRALSPAQAPQAAGDWLDGFLSDAGQVLLHDNLLFAAVDAYLLALSEDDFTTLLPMLRRTFSTFGAMERRRILERARDDRVGSPAIADGESVAPGFERALPLLLRIMGLSQ
jgi:hypothetical protein